MLNQLLTTEYLFWLVAFLFYVVECIKLSKPNQLILAESATCKFFPIISFNSFEISGKEVNFLNLLTPYSTYVKLDTEPKSDPGKGLLRADRLIKIFQKNLLPFRIIGIIAFTYLCLGLLFTYLIGIAATFAILLPIHLLLILISFAFLIKSRVKLNLTWGELGTLCFELLLVPAYLAAITKKIADKQKYYCDGFIYVLKNSDDPEETNYLISRKIDLLMMGHDESDIKFNAYKSYKLNLGLKNEQQ